MKNYFNTFKGLPKEAFVFALMTLINRIGAMVIPFLSKYLYEDLLFSYAQIGTIMLFFGLGSFSGTLIVAKLSKHISSHKLMIISMLSSGALLFMLQFVKSFYLFGIAVFLYSMFADMFRPVMITTLKDFVVKSERIRALSLIRLASNFGFVVSPIIAGLVILNLGYSFLFIIDSITSITAILIFAVFVKERKIEHKLVFKNYQEEKFPFLKDKLLLMHCLITVLTGFVFFQIFSILPLYYNVYLKLDTSYNSLFLIFYGVTLFLFEIPIVEYVKKKKMFSLNSILYGLLFMALGYLTLVVFSNLYAVFFAIVVISIGSMLTFSFATDYVLKRSYKRQEGKFLSFFQISYSIAHILSAKVGLYLVDNFGYTTNFMVNVFIAIIGALLSYYLIKASWTEKKEKEQAIAKSFFK